jgi:PhnB protein
MLADEFPDMGVRSPKTIGGSPVTVCCTSRMSTTCSSAPSPRAPRRSRPVEDKFYGDRAGQIEDPWGHRWSLMTHVEDVSPEEMQKRAAEYAEQQ